MTRKLTVEIDGDASGFKRAAGETVDAGGRIDHSLRNSAVGGAVAGLAMGGVTMAVDFVTEALAGAADAAKEDTASQDRLALALRNTGRAQALTTEQIEAAISANQAKGVSDSEQREGIAQFLDKTKDATAAMELNQAAVELAAAKGIAYSEAEAMVVSALAGKTAALNKAGVEVERGASATDIAAAINGKYAGSLDAVAATQGGKSRIASEKMGEAMESIGRIVNKVSEVVIPALADALTWVMDNVVPPLAQAFKVAGPIIAGVFDFIGRAVGVYLNVMRGIMGVVGPIIGTMGRVFRGLGELVGDVFGGIGGAIRAGINAVVRVVNSIIRGINSIQVHIAVGPVRYDFDGLNLGYLPTMHQGGIVPGTPGSDVLTILQAGERVTPAGSAAQVININIESFTGSDRDIDQFADRLALRLRLAGA